MIFASLQFIGLECHFHLLSPHLLGRHNSYLIIMTTPVTVKFNLIFSNFINKLSTISYKIIQPWGLFLVEVMFCRLNITWFRLPKAIESGIILFEEMFYPHVVDKIVNNSFLFRLFFFFHQYSPVVFQDLTILAKP